MRILHVISSCNPKIGGPIQGIRNYQKHIAEKGIKRDVVCFEDQKDIEKWSFPESLNVIGLGKSKGIWQYNKNLKFWLKKNYMNYHSIIINGLWIYNSYGVVKTIKTIKKDFPTAKIPKLYIFCHGMLDPWFQKSNGRIIKSIRNSIYWHVIEKKVVNYVDGLFFTTEQEKELARSTFWGYNPKNEINIGYGIETPPKKNNDLIKTFLLENNLEEGTKYLLYLSRIDPKKGLDILLKVYLYLLESEEYRSKIPMLLVGGDINESNYSKEQYQFLTKNPKLKEKVKFLGHLSGDRKWSAIHGCEAFVLPSHTENFGIAVAESLGCAKPVIITNKVNIYKQVEKFKAGLISSDTFEGVLDSLMKWIEMDSKSKSIIGENAFGLFKNKYQSKDAVERFITFLKNDKND